MAAAEVRSWAGRLAILSLIAGATLGALSISICPKIQHGR